MTTLVEKMRAIGTPELREKADALEVATAGFHGEPQTHNVKQFIGAWARARRAYCDHTGEDLV